MLKSDNFGFNFQEETNQTNHNNQTYSNNQTQSKLNFENRNKLIKDKSKNETTEKQVFTKHKIKQRKNRTKPKDNKSNKI